MSLRIKSDTILVQTDVIKIKSNFLLQRMKRDLHRKIRTTSGLKMLDFGTIIFYIPALADILLFFSSVF